ncbi:putative short-chain dehydrogenase/reductase family 42E member 2 [Lampris incognitus]|uniref:putative short-chain dehydrogenase/reductase family 42E member 2 n=1 Tax=Lampris incognitus TaxID=2546036 RepID=UPI0024B506F5|nr:putative short-chain dehydrogenase/reductase family 42E member 2 [Lampris incognitus]
MELCGSTMTESGSSVCQVEQLVCTGVVSLAEPNGRLCRRQANEHQFHNLHHFTHQPWANHPTSAVATQHRASGAVEAWCNTLDCAVSGKLEERVAAVACGGRGKVLVTGGGGYFGFRLGRALAIRGVSVILLDLHEPPWDIPDGAVFYQSDVRDYASLFKVCEGVKCVFHLASYGMSGPEQLKREKVESVNVGGTSNIINVCKERGIPQLVYTSTVNVVFAGKPIEEGDEESVPCVPLNKHIDHYSRTKAIADQMVLSANRSSITGGGLLRTCVLRPSGIYGPGERRHLHRVMVNVERRLFSFSFGDPQARMNWVHVDNLVQAHILAAEALTPKRNHVASGQAYFINDGESVNLFEWLTPLFEKLGCSRPLIHLPVSLVYSAAILVEYLHMVLSPIVEIPLLFTRNEVRNIAVSHTFRTDKARRELGFCPRRYSLADSVEQYLKSRPPRSRSSLLDLSWASQPSQPLVLLMMLGLSLVLLLLCSHLCQY